MPILTPAERLGQLIADRYRLDVVLSRGGMGVLFAGSDVTCGQRVAVKMLKPADSLEEQSVERFVRESRIAASLRHPNVTEVFEVGVDESGLPFLVMELLEGRSLQQELDARGSLPLEEVLSILLPISDALSAAHEAGIVHRDIKPANIFLSSSPAGEVTPKLLDFGIAKTRKDEFETQTGHIVGTPEYMAPEQARRGECSASTDVWGIAAVAYRCLSGAPPHTGSSVPEILAKLVSEPVAPLSNPGLSNLVAATIDRALARQPHRRYSSMEAFAHALAAAAATDSGIGDGGTLDIAAPAFVVPTSGDDEGLAPSTKPHVSSRKFTPARVLASTGLGLMGLVGLLSLGAVGSNRRERPASEQASPSARAPSQANDLARLAEQKPPAAAPAPEPTAPKRELVDPPDRARATAKSADRASPRPEHGSSTARRPPKKAPVPSEAESPATRGAATTGPEREKTSGFPLAVEW